MGFVEEITTVNPGHFQAQPFVGARNSSPLRNKAPRPVSGYQRRDFDSYGPPMPAPHYDQPRMIPPVPLDGPGPHKYISETRGHFLHPSEPFASSPFRKAGPGPHMVMGGPPHPGFM